jgi:hypothetical protein
LNLANNSQLQTALVSSPSYASLNLNYPESAFKGIILTDHDYRNVLDVANQFCLIYDGGIKRIDDKRELVR